MPNKSLTAAFVATIKDSGKYHDGSGNGLFLLVKPTGARSWVQRIIIRGKRREIGLGSPPIISLANAREQAINNKRTAHAGGDPLADKRKAKTVLTFREAAIETHAELAPTLKNPKDRAAFLTSLETYVFTGFGSVALPDVTSADVRQVILAAREKAPGVAKKLIYRISFVFKWGIAEGMCSHNPSNAASLALPRDTHKPKHRKALPYSRVSECIAAVNASGAWLGTKLALEFLVLTATRSGEVRKARWDQLELHDTDDIEDATRVTWLFEAVDKKEARSFKLPLPLRAVEILREARTISDDSGLLFPSSRGKVISDMTLSKLVKNLGFDADVHGFRASFRTWTQEQTNFPREVAEAALAHKIGDAAEQAYARSDVFEKRRKLMETWASYLAVRRGELINLTAN